METTLKPMEFDHTRCLARKRGHPTLGPGYGSQCNNKHKSGSHFCGIHDARLKTPTPCKLCSKHNSNNPVTHTYKWQCAGRVDQPIPTYFKCCDCKHQLKNCQCRAIQSADELGHLDNYDLTDIRDAMNGDGDVKLVTLVSEIIFSGNDNMLDTYLEYRSNIKPAPKTIPTPCPNVQALTPILVKKKIRYIDLAQNLFTYRGGRYNYVGLYTYKDAE